jgi:hypothetical protein
MLYFAYFRDEFLFSSLTLDAVLAFVADVNEPQFGEDAVVWCGPRVVAVCRSDGTVIHFDSGNPPASPAAAEVLADLARLDEAAA